MGIGHKLGVTARRWRQRASIAIQAPAGNDRTEFVRVIVPGRTEGVCDGVFTAGGGHSTEDMTRCDREGGRAVNRVVASTSAMRPLKRPTIPLICGWRGGVSRCSMPCSAQSRSKSCAPEGRRWGGVKRSVVADSLATPARQGRRGVIGLAGAGVRVGAAAAARSCIVARSTASVTVCALGWFAAL